MSGPVNHLTEQDRVALAAMITSAAEHLVSLKALAARHALDLTGDTLSAISRAECDLEMEQAELRLITHHLKAA